MQPPSRRRSHAAGAVTPRDCQDLSRLLQERSGMLLSPDKRYLVEQRLGALARKVGCSTDELLARLRAADQLIGDAVEALTINETAFFRDRPAFDQLRAFVLPRLFAARGASRPLRIWCAACASGQEAYSVAMLVREMQATVPVRVEIVATDFSREMVERASAARYSQFEVQRGVPSSLLIKYFRQAHGSWELLPELRRTVSVRRHNLLHDPAPLGMFDLILCRNVLMYFSEGTRAATLERLADRLSRDGYLMLGATEMAFGAGDAFRAVPEQRGLFSLDAPGAGSAPRANLFPPIETAAAS